MELLFNTLKKLVLSTLCFLMFFNVLTVNIIADSPTSESQIGKYYLNADEGDYTEASSEYRSYENGNIKLWKTIYPTDKENEFNIKLKVESRTRAEEYREAHDAAVVLVLDISTSLGSDAQSKMLEATKKFITNFGTNNDGMKRYVSLVTFCQNIQTYDWTDVSNASNRTTLLNRFKSSDSLFTLNGGTNTPGALQYAKKYLDTRLKLELWGFLFKTHRNGFIRAVFVMFYLLR